MILNSIHEEKCAICKQVPSSLSQTRGGNTVILGVAGIPCTTTELCIQDVTVNNDGSINDNFRFI